MSVQKEEFKYQEGFADAMKQVTDHITRMTTGQVTIDSLISLMNDLVQMRHESMVTLMTLNEESHLQGGN